MKSCSASGQVIVSVSPFKCRMWALHDRAEEGITEENCREELASFSRHGQLVPALGRPLRNDSRHEIELIFGARRLFVARQLNIPLRVELRELSDREAIVAMDIENRQRRDVSAYERGTSYARWLREGHFGSQDEIASALRVSASQISRLLKIARLPPVVVNAFVCPSQICEAWGLELAAALEDPQRRAHALRAAREIASLANRPSPREVSRRLLSAPAPGRKPVARTHDEVILCDGGKPLFRIRYERAWIDLKLPVGRVSGKALQEIRTAVTSILSGSLQLPLH